MDEVIVLLFQKYPVLATVLAAIVAAHSLAIVVVNLTPTPKDDAFVASFYRWVEVVAGIVTRKVKGTGASDEGSHEDQA